MNTVVVITDTLIIPFLSALGVGDVFLLTIPKIGDRGEEDDSDEDRQEALNASRGS
jgi:hypothetical protein